MQSDSSVEVVSVFTKVFNLKTALLIIEMVFFFCCNLIFFPAPKECVINKQYNKVKLPLHLHCNMIPMYTKMFTLWSFHISSHGIKAIWFKYQHCHF